jgi:formyl-CoA transferase
VTLDLKSPRGRDLLLELVAKSDAVIENYRPGQLERWGVGPDDIARVNPRCVVVHISGFGQDGPYRDKVAFGVVGEAIGGIRHLTGYPEGVTDLPPVRAGISLGDSVAGMYGVIGLLAALYDRDVGKATTGRTIDVALHEAVFSLLEGSLPEYGKFGVIREPSGSALPTTAPSNAYRCADGQWMIIAGNSDRIYARLMILIGRPDLAGDQRLTTNAGRVRHAAELDAAIGAWTRQLAAADAQAALEGAEVPATRIYTIADIAADAHFIARGMVQRVDDPEHGEVLHPGAVPKFDGAGTTVRWTGPRLGEHNREILSTVLNLTDEQIRTLEKAGAI